MIQISDRIIAFNNIPYTNMNRSSKGANIIVQNNVNKFQCTGIGLL